MRYLKNNCTDPYYNMAFDEFCLEQCSIAEPIFFLWQNRPSVIIGANQQVHTEANLDYLQKNDIALVRRVTGGGAVYHDLGNLNYTIVGCSKDLDQDYPEYTTYMLKALQELGISATLSGRNDIMVHDRKVSGFAKRVYKDRLMVHGTLMYDVDLDKLTNALCPPENKFISKGIASVRSRVTNLKNHLPYLPNIQLFKNELERILSGNYKDQQVILNQEDLDTIAKLAKQKFATWEWIYGSSPQATCTRSARFACGTIQVNMTIKSGCISACHFSGDFIGNLPVAEIETLLTGIAYERNSLYECLAKIELARYFDGITTTEFIELLL